MCILSGLMLSDIKLQSGGYQIYPICLALNRCWPIWALDEITHSPKKGVWFKSSLGRELNQLFDQSSLMFGAQ